MSYPNNISCVILFYCRTSVSYFFFSVGNMFQFRRESPPHWSRVLPENERLSLIHSPVTHYAKFHGLLFSAGISGRKESSTKERWPIRHPFCLQDLSAFIYKNSFRLVLLHPKLLLPEIIKKQCDLRFKTGT